MMNKNANSDCAHRELTSIFGGAQEVAHVKMTNEIAAWHYVKQNKHST